MKEIQARIRIYSINEEELPINSERFLIVHGDGNQIHLEIDGKKYGVIADDLTEAIDRCEGWR